MEEAIAEMQASLLHARGGVSLNPNARQKRTWSSPRSWRCFFVPVDQVVALQVFSTLVEVFPVSAVSPKSSNGLLHARGGVSKMQLFVASL